jgi:hypothetical protein
MPSRHVVRRSAPGTHASPARAHDGPYHAGHVLECGWRTAEPCGGTSCRPHLHNARTHHVVERRTQWLDLTGAFAIRGRPASGWNASRRSGVWHDRAMFHFLWARRDRTCYRTFCDQHCGTTARRSPCRSWRAARSLLGLPVARYGPDALVAALGDDVEMVMSWRGEHTTSTGVVQPFSWVVVRLSSGRAPREG